MVSIQQRSDNAFKEISGSLFEVNDYLSRTSRTLKRNLYLSAFRKLLIRLRNDFLINLTDYSATGSNKRDNILEEAFKLMEHLLGFEFNREGSFTRQGAITALAKDLKIVKNVNKLKIVVTGKLEDLEYGINSWDNLRRFFYRNATRNALKKFFSSESIYDEFYRKLDMLFNKESEKGRPYISQAITVGSGFMHDVVKEQISAAFSNQGQWIKR